MCPFVRRSVANVSNLSFSSERRLSTAIFHNLKKRLQTFFAAAFILKVFALNVKTCYVNVKTRYLITMDLKGNLKGYNVEVCLL